MSNKLVTAMVQVNAGPDLAANLKLIEPMIHSAKQSGAELITLPENAALIVKDRAQTFKNAVPEEDHPAVAFFARMAKETGTWILAGSVAVSTGHDRLANRSLLFDPKGQVAARYDKIHMFDADLSANEFYRESDNFRSGNMAVLAPMAWGKIGLTVCYDLRFPHLYRALAKGGANIITIPAAFTATTGRMHWHVLVRARAIETSCFIIAPAQCGTHDQGRLTFGHSLVVAPNGAIIAEGGDEPAVIMAELQLDKVAEMRKMLPTLMHDRDFEGPL